MTNKHMYLTYSEYDGNYFLLPLNLILFQETSKRLKLSFIHIRKQKMPKSRSVEEDRHWSFTLRSINESASRKCIRTKLTKRREEIQTGSARISLHLFWPCSFNHSIRHRCSILCFHKTALISRFWCTHLCWPLKDKWGPIIHMRHSKTRIDQPTVATHWNTCAITTHHVWV